MSDQDIPDSGSRGEPADGAADETMPQPVGTPAEPATVFAEQAASPQGAAEDTAAEHSAVPAAGEAAPISGRRLPRRLRKRSAVAVAGVGLVLAGGLGGFVVGHAIAAGDGSGSGVTTDADPSGFRGGPQDRAGHGARPGDRQGSGQDGPVGAGSPSGDDDGGSA